MEIEIFEAEASIKDKILDNKISIASVIKNSKRDADKEKDIVLFESKASTANPNQRDLFYFDSILVSTGWNKNDDVFSREELWNARATPVDKQVNFMHNEKVIIGHMTDSFILDETSEIITPETIDDLPEKFDIGVSSVIYTAWSDEDFMESISSLVEELTEGKWFVSMEARFPAFDYAVETPDGEQKVIARNKDTAFLSKYLRAYEGSGEYEGHKIGRLLKGLFFVGKGVVNKPANERSVILSTAKQFKSKASLNNFPGAKRKMEEELKKELDTVKAQLTTATTKLADVETHKAAAAELATKLEASEKLVAEHKTVVAQLTEKVQALETQVAEFKKKEEEDEKMKAKASRIELLVKAGLEQVKAEEVFARFETATDEQFADVVTLHAAVKPKEDKEDKSKEKVEANLDEAKVEKSVAGAIDEDSTTEVSKAAATWIASAMLKTNKKTN